VSHPYPTQPMVGLPFVVVGRWPPPPNYMSPRVVAAWRRGLLLVRRTRVIELLRWGGGALVSLLVRSFCDVTGN